eukprot:361874-Chlamydomonas_euryale.AAC.2
MSHASRGREVERSKGREVARGLVHTLEQAQRQLPRQPIVARDNARAGYQIPFPPFPLAPLPLPSHPLTRWVQDLAAAGPSTGAASIVCAPVEFVVKLAELRALRHHVSREEERSVDWLKAARCQELQCV